MKKINIILFLLIFSLIVGCSNINNSVKVKINNEETTISQNVLDIVTKKNQPTIKQEINPNAKGDIELEYQNTLYKIFDDGDNAIVWSKQSGEFNQYEITKEEYNKLKKSLN